MANDPTPKRRWPHLMGAQAEDLVLLHSNVIDYHVGHMRSVIANKDPYVRAEMAEGALHGHEFHRQDYAGMLDALDADEAQAAKVEKDGPHDLVDLLVALEHRIDALEAWLKSTEQKVHAHRPEGAL